MTLGTWLHCPACGTRVRVRFDGSIIALLSEAAVAAKVLELAADHAPACAAKHAGCKS